MEALAQRAAMTCDELVAYLDRKTDPSLDKLRRLAAALNLQLPTLLRRVEARELRLERRDPSSRKARP
jgi:hypothetical protein